MYLPFFQSLLGGYWARAEIQKYFSSFFGSNEDIQKSFWNYLTSSEQCLHQFCLWINLPEKNLFKINLLTSENLYISFFLDIINFLLNFHSISKPFLLHSSQTVICQFSNLLSMRIIGIWNFWNKILKLKFIYSEKATKFDKLFW